MVDHSTVQALPGSAELVVPGLVYHSIAQILRENAELVVDGTCCVSPPDVVLEAGVQVVVEEPAYLRLLELMQAWAGHHPWMGHSEQV